jgi:trehalose 6-phosphate phosphatase
MHPRLDDTIEAIEIDLRRASLFLDLDGTLAEFESAPSLVGPSPDRSSLIARACAMLQGRLAVISGRPVADIDRILEGSSPCVAGVHGLERRSLTGFEAYAEDHPGLPDAVGAFTAVAKARPGLLVEEKPMSVALHYRNAPGAAEAVRELAQRLAETHGLVLQEGSMVAELRPPGPDKGDAIRRFMKEPPFAGSTPIFVGDDLTDEAGFAAAAALGGMGVLVGPPRPTAAASRIASPSQVLSWIGQSLDAGAFVLEPVR